MPRSEEYTTRVTTITAPDGVAVSITDDQGNVWKRQPHRTLQEPRQVWALVTVEDHHGDTTPRLLDGIEPDKARAALAELMTWRPGYGPSERFNPNNPGYVARSPLGVVIKDHYGVDPDEIVAELNRRADARIARIAPKRSADFERDHPKAHAELQAAGLTWAENQKNRAYRGNFEFFEHPQTAEDGLTVIAELVQERRTSSGSPCTAESLAAWCEGDEDAPFCSEAYLYTLAGKDIARSFLGKLRTLRQALGTSR